MKYVALALGIAAPAAATLHTLEVIPGFKVGDTNPTHYGSPYSGDCMDDEVAIQIQGVDGSVCSPACTGVLSMSCSTDIPDSVTATPTCALQDASSGSRYCALICSSTTDEASLRLGDSQCGDASCKSIQGLGICTYDETAAELEGFEAIAEHVNSKKTTWTAEAPSRFNTTADAKALCGTWLSDHPNYFRLPEKKFLEAVNADDTPTDFDARTAWPKCTVIQKIRDQSSCGSCWAFGSTESFEDRRCIATGEDKEFSSYDTAACCSGFSCGFSQGCGGGQPSAAWKWFKNKGVVSGGDFADIGSGSTCIPYLFEPCAHHVDSTKYPACPTTEYSTKCSSSCSESKFGASYSDDKTKAKTSYSVSGVDNIKAELVKNGPLAVAFTVYADFPTYKSGVYKHTTGSALGGHAVEMIGFGVEDGEEYWLVKNSWNEEWGDGGVFKIAHGECGIENDVSGGSF